MILAIASGKGGTGKTTVAVNLALSAPAGRPVMLLDCDVEEPNCHIFFKPEIRERRAVGIPVPVVDEAKCTSCGECGRICQYHAIVSLKTKPLVFPELCHGCGGCTKVCPTGAIAEVDHEAGIVEIGGRLTGVSSVGAGLKPAPTPEGASGFPIEGIRREIGFVSGLLKVGHPMSPPLIRAVKKYALPDGITIIDCPPGTSCPVIAAVRGADYVLLVTEPTPFGLHDLTLAVETVRKLDLPFGVVVNRSDSGDSRVTDYCRKEGVPVLLEIPEDRRVAEAYSRGEAMVEALPEYRQAFERLWAGLKLRLKKGDE